MLRLEDLDRTRVKPGAHEETIELLRWLGMDWDGPPRTLSDTLDPYRAAMRHLEAHERIFRCDRSRRDLLLAIGAPHADDGETPHPASLRPTDESAWRFTDEQAGYRLCVDDEAVHVHDHLAGAHTFHPAQEAGDFPVWSKLGVPAYQLAISVDDGADRITDVVRGDDLLASAARQQIVHAALQQAAPQWWHLPLVCDEEGRRLAKRSGTHRLTICRDAQIPGDAVVGLVAYWCGVVEAPAQLSPAAFLRHFDPAALPSDPVRLTQRQLTWLMEQR